MISEWTIVDFLHTGPWWKNRRLLALNLWLLLPLMTSTTNGLDMSLLNGLQILPEWQKYYGFPKGKVLGVINSAQFIGGLFALPVAPLLADGIGRRGTLFIGSLIMLCGVAVQAMSFNVPMFIAARIIVGLGIQTCTIASPLLLIELSYPTHRGKITSMYNSTWYLGSIISAWVCFAAYNHAAGSVWTWRIPTLVQALVPVVQVLSVWFMPESPRYLVSKGLQGKAAKILAQYHTKGGDEDDPLVVFELAQIRHAIRMEEEISQTTTWKTLFATPGNRKRMRIIIAISVFSQWSGNGLVSYYINLILEGVGIDDTKTKAAINGGLQVFNYIIAITAAMSVDWIGRRPLFILSNLGMLFAFSGWTVSNALYNTLGSATAAKATIPLIFLFFFFYDIAYTPMLVAYTLEILPYKTRARGFAVMSIVVMATAAFNQFVNPWAIQAIGWWYYLVYCGWLVGEFIFVVTFIVETKGRTLEETAMLFDGTQHIDDLAAMGGDAAHTRMRLNRRSALSIASTNPEKDHQHIEYHGLVLPNKSSQRFSAAVTVSDYDNETVVNR
ncbi:general substrate transporter [Pluteus cervinus]|uniref:General substrate transporter n=1 Tax=Pluteus cervinus TaxID=181527 RepID=A0ACD3BBN5_9AGAR|nr:general substrate transporter [Pluteus cervinus]